MGRFISPDPVGLSGGDPNLYAYVGNDPLNATDPLGLYMEINDHLIVTPGGPHITRPYEWMSPLDQVFSGPFAPDPAALVGWDSYRSRCPWGKFAAHGCDAGNDDLGNLLNGLVPAIDPERAFITGLEVSYLALSGWAIGEGCLASLSLGPFAPAGCGAVAGADYAFGRWVYDQGAFEGSYLDPEW